MELFRNPNIDFLGKKWYFLAFSLVFSVAGALSMIFWHGVPLGVDFRGGTLVYVKFNNTPDDNKIRALNVVNQHTGTAAESSALNIDLLWPIKNYHVNGRAGGDDYPRADALLDIGCAGAGNVDGES